ncbi:fibronectin type III domain-containing protein [Pimelobacter simplex]|uniref:Fibronectin type III domain-containing protein n=1 Tax=Nocardioides simplex TaxID=2045 RepID=A0A7J5DXV1_NOCSI|nr:fibronectin type III domain-containing protein [Pimelobacter simplex]KAB2810831.1 fibronectin type III domain-containing protein [Pimelobacter simplex]
MGMLVRPLQGALTTTLLTVLLVAAASVVPAQAAARPSPPRAVHAAPADGAVRVTWTAPARKGGSRIDRYAVQRRTAPSGAWSTVRKVPGTSRAWTVTGLSNGVRYGVRVRAHSASGWGAWSAEATAVPRGTPGAVLTPEADVHREALGVYWQAPTTTNGAAIDSYRVEIGTDGATWRTQVDHTGVANPASPVLVTGLTPGTRYWIRVRAHNAAGFGPASGAGPYRVLTAPNPVPNLVATPGDGSVDLTWDEPAVANGIPAATGYKVESSTDGGTTWTELGTTAATSYAATGLANGTSYLFRVSARAGNVRLGYGAPALASPTVPTGAPGVPLGLGLGWDPVAETYRLTWAAPASDGGEPLTHYLVQQGALAPQLVAAPATGLDAGPAALDDGFRVQACNGRGCGPWTALVGPVPAPVGDLTASAVRAGSSYTVTVGWTAPANAAPTSYQVLRSADGVTFTEVGTTTGTTFDDLTGAPATTYTYRVVGRYPGGSGRPAATGITTGPLHDLSVTPGTLVVDEGGTAELTVSLDRPATTDTVVVVTSDDPDAAAPASPSVTIPAGQTTATVTVVAPPDADSDDELVTLTVDLSGQTRTVTVTVLDP